jgi:hypothetical protein
MTVKPTERSIRTLIALTAVLGVVCVAPSVADAEFSRPYLTQLTTGEEFGRDAVDTVTVDPASAGNAYVGVAEEGENASGRDNGTVDVFSSSNVFTEQIHTGCKSDLAFDDKSGKLECGALLAIDNSTNAQTTGDVYTGEINFEFKGKIKRLSANGQPAPFDCQENGKTPDYIVNGDELIGTPSELWNEHSYDSPALEGVAVDSGAGADAGDLYVISNLTDAIDQFSPEGCFVRAISEAGVPLKGFDTKYYTDQLKDIAVDPASGDVVLAIRETAPTGVEIERIDEFTAAGEYLGQITGTSKATPFGELALNSGHGLNIMAVGSDGDLYANVCDDYVKQVINNKDESYCAKPVVDVFGPGAYYPGVVSGGESATPSGSVTLHGTVRGVTDTVKGVNLPLTACRFEYVSEEAFDKAGVNEVQTLSVTGATGGSFSLSDGGESTGATGTGNLVGPASGTGETIAGVNAVLAPHASSGAFVAGQLISGEGIPVGTKIVSVLPGGLVLSAPAGVTGDVTISAGSDEVSGLETSSGKFVVGEEVSGEGIPVGTRITGVAGGALRLSADVSVSASGVKLSSGIPYNAPAGVVQAALEALSSLGAHGVRVGGGAGGPYTVEFVGPLAHMSVAVLGAGSAGLTPEGASVSSVVSTAASDDGAFHEAKALPCAPGLVGQRLEEKNYAVSAEITEGLVAGRTYRYRLVAATLEGAERGAVNDEAAVESFAAPSLPAVEGVTVSDVSSSWAAVHATIDPAGSDTTYQVQYVRASEYDASASDPYAGGGLAPATPGDAGSGDRSVSVNVQAGGLTAGSEYDYRVVASNAVGVADSANGVFSTAPAVASGSLADGRAYEMVTPPNKEDGTDLFGAKPSVSAEIHHEDSTNYDRGYSSEDGEHFLLKTSAAFGGFPAAYANTYVFSRGAEGWTSQASASPLLGVQSGTAAVYDSLNFSALAIDMVQSTGHGHEQVLSLVGPPGGPYTTISSGEKSSAAEAGIDGASADLSRVVLDSTDGKLAPAPNKEKQDAGSRALYEWSAAGGLALVDIDPQGHLFKCGAALGQDGRSIPTGGTHAAVSADGSKIVFTAPDPKASGAAGCWSGSSNPPEVYVREDGERTVQVSAPNTGVTKTPAEPAIYVGASKDDSKVFFMTRGELTEEAVKLGLHSMELYEYDSEAPEGQRVARVSAGEEGTPGRDTGAGVLQVVALSNDGSVVYFNAASQLTSDAPADGGLYRYEAGSAKTVFIAPSSGYSSSFESGFEIVWYQHILSGVYAGLAGDAPYYTTGDGKFLLFGSTQNLTGYNSNGQEELYRYTYEPQSPSGGSIVCVSCDPTGAAPSYPARFTRSYAEEENPAGTAPRPISENGDYVFFDSQQSLLPAATNGNVDVYEWELEGAGACPPASGGCLSLISTGQSSSNDYFLDSSPDGRNVFFGTHSKLVPADTDEQGDLYDARIDGGFPAPLGAGPCEGDACENPPPAPIDQTPASLSFSGPGDIATETASTTQSKTKTVSKKTGKCKTGYVKKKDKCVVRHERKGMKKHRAKKGSVRS